MLRINHISFAYQSDKPLLKDLSLEVQTGEHVFIIGESGCGKSTLLKAIYGLFDLPEGTIHFNDKRVFGPSFQLVPGYGAMKYLAQDFDLGPYHTVAENVGRYLSNIDLEWKRARVAELLALVGMERFASQKALVLSGGEKQRVALAMALAQEPELLLLDEPFSQVDSFRKNDLQRTLFAYLKEKNISCMVATHDGKEVLSFADKVFIMRDGSMLHYDTMMKVYTQDTDRYTASLFGEVSLHNGKLLRPHQIAITPQSDWQMTVEHSYFQGAHYLIEGLSAEGKVYVNHEKALPEGAICYLCTLNRI